MTKRPLSESKSPVTVPKFDGKEKHLDVYKSLRVMQISVGDRFIKPTPERISKMMESLARDGQQHPIIVHSVTLGTYRVISGATRLVAARELGWNYIQCKIDPGEYKAGDHQIAELVENEYRADLSEEEQPAQRAAGRAGGEPCEGAAGTERPAQGDGRTREAGRHQ
jgi:hypothetical protein